MSVEEEIINSFSKNLIKKNITEPIDGFPLA